MLAGLLLGAAALGGCGGGGDGPMITAAAQTLRFTTTPSLRVGETGSTSATASSGLAVRYASSTPAICSIEASGTVKALAAGTCTLTADQAGNADWAPAGQASLSFTVTLDPRQTLQFAAAPSLSLGGTATVSAAASSGLAVRYSSLTPTVCGIDAGSGQVNALGPGECQVAADQPGDGTWQAAPQARLTLAVQIPAGMTTPRAPSGVSATLGADARTVVVSIGGVDSGGQPITGYTVQSLPAGITASASAAPITVTCPSRCAGHAFTVRARNVLGEGETSAAAEVITRFAVNTVFHEPDTQPRDTIFNGSFSLNSTTGTISGLAGQLSESMTGQAKGDAPLYDMTLVPLTHQLQHWRDEALGGTFVASFSKDSTSTFSTIAGGDGWSPAAGVAIGGVYAGFPRPHAGSIQNAYVLIFVPDDPFAPLTQAQIDKLAYADCAPGGMMGAVCMTATSVAGYGAIGTMSGYPVSQRLTRD